MVKNFRTMIRLNSRKQILLIISLMINLSAARAQSPYFLQDGTKWMYYTRESTEPGMSSIRSYLEESIVLGDTIINSINYKKLFTRKEDQVYIPMFGTTQYSYSGPYLYYLRHDTLNRKMFLFSDTSLVEVLLSDFNLNIGDTIPVRAPFSGPWVIDSTEQLTLFGQASTKFYIRDPNFPSGSAMVDNYFIEGMGGSNGLIYFNPVEIVLSGGIFMTRLQCFQSGDSIYPNYFGAACPQFTGIVDNATKNVNYTVFPNPASEGFFIQTNSLVPFKNLKVELLDLSGRVIFKDEIISSSDYIRPNVNSGFYLWKVFDAHGLKGQGKLFIKQN